MRGRVRYWGAVEDHNPQSLRRSLLYSFSSTEQEESDTPSRSTVDSIMSYSSSSMYLSLDFTATGLPLPLFLRKTATVCSKVVFVFKLRK